MDTIKKSDESIKDYKIRLFKNKDLYDLTLNDIRNLINDVTGDNKSTDVYRKWFQPYNEGYEDGYEDALKQNDYSDRINDIENAKIELKKERYKLQTTKNEFDKKLRKYSRFELFYHNIKENIQTLPVPDFEDIFSKNESIWRGKKEYVLTISDIHYNSNFVGLNNKYSRDICMERFKIMFNILIEKIKEQNIKKLNILNLGDTIQGMIHVNDIYLNETSVVNSVIEVSRLISNFLNALSKYCEIEYYHIPMANHSQIRPLNTKASEIATEDMELIITNYIHDVLINNKRIKIHKDYEYDFIKFQILNTKCIALHGHQVKSIENVLKDLTLQHREFYDICFMGHKHSAKEITISEGINNNTEVLMSPSFIGSCPYSQKLMVGSKSAVKLYEFDEKYGHIGTQNIILN